MSLAEQHPKTCTCPWCSCPDDPGSDPRVESWARDELLAARKNLMRALKLIDGGDLPGARSKARLDILDAVAEVEEAHLFLGGSEQGE